MLTKRCKASGIKLDRYEELKEQKCYPLVVPSKSIFVEAKKREGSLQIWSPFSFPKNKQRCS